MNIFTQQLPGLFVGLFRIMFGILWLQAALQKAPWVFNAQGQRFGWLSNWIWQEIQHPTFQFYKAFLETVVFPNSILRPFFGYMTFVVEIALGLSLLLGICTVLSGLGGALAVQHCPRQLLGPRRVALDLAAPHRPTSRLCAQPCRPQRGCGSVPASVARTKPQRPNGPRAVSAPLHVRHRGDSKGHPYAHCDDYPSPG